MDKLSREANQIDWRCSKCRQREGVDYALGRWLCRECWKQAAEAEQSELKL